ncbi:hypothetical protein BRD20_09045 [Halobacteriales archaeon SW_8_65_20]|nr:MAG: hypothetical protein BRD20_09045 [Halobacteriales archaeon SW_8_65_20]
MTLQQITAADIAGWDSLQDIADSFEKRGLKPRPKLGEDHELVLQLADDEFVVLVNAGPGESATDFKPDNRSRHTNLVATNDFKEFTFLTRMRSWEGQQHGRIKHQKISFTKGQFTRDSGEKNTVLKKLNSIEYGSSAAIYDTLYDTQQVVKEFYEEFEDLRTDLVQEVSGIPDDRGDAKQRYVQVILDRMIFLYFIQEKRLLDRNPNYLHEQPGEVVDDGEDRYENFYRPLFFDYLAEPKQNPDFGSLPYLNGGLFAKNPIEEEFPNAKLGESAEETNELFNDILDFLSDWNWNVDERLDIVDPKNLSPEILGHIFEQTVNQKEMGAYYTPEEITGYMSRRTIHPYLLNQLNDAPKANYDEIDDVFGFSGSEASGGEPAVADGGTMTQQVPTENVETNHVETLYHDILKEAHVLDPAVGSGAFLLAAQDVLVDIYIQCIEFFQQLEQEDKGWELEARTRDELEEINRGQGSASLYAKRTVILNNLYGVDIDEGAVEICKLRLWLSMVADIEDEPNEVEPLPNIDFNIRQGDSLIGFNETEVVVDNQKLLITEMLKSDLKEYREAIRKYRTSDVNVSQARSSIDELHDDLEERLNGWYTSTLGIDIKEDVSNAAELERIVADSDDSITLKLKFENEISESLDSSLNEIGFRTWKTSANLELDNTDILAGKHEDVFSLVTISDLSNIFVEREIQKSDITELDPFHWVMEFPEAYLGDDPGFDMILENPPYIRVEKITQPKKKIYKNQFKTAYGRCDIYVPFIQRTTELLHSQGRYSCITSNQFMSAQYGEKIREFLTDETGVSELVDFTNYSPFEGITAYSAILVGGRNPTEEISCTSLRSEDAVAEFMSHDVSNREGSPIIQFDIPVSFLDTEQWLILPDDERRIVNTLSDRSSQVLGDVANVGSPLKTGKDELLKAVIENQENDIYSIKNDRLSADVESKYWKKLIGAAEAGDWTVEDPQSVVFFPYKKEGDSYELIPEDVIKDSKSYQILKPYKNELLDYRRDSGETFRERGEVWYSLARYGSPQLFEENKTAVGGVIDGPAFSLDTHGYVVASGAGNARGISPHDLDEYYLLGYLNSRAVYGYLKSIASPKSGGYISVENNVLERVPVITADIREVVKSEFRQLLADYEDDYEGLLDKIQTGQIVSLIGVDVTPDEAFAGVVREISRYLCDNHRSLSDEEQSILEEINHYAVYELVGFTDEDISIIEANI